jgi:hypothetical protein
MEDSPLLLRLAPALGKPREFEQKETKFHRRTETKIFVILVFFCDDSAKWKHLTSQSWAADPPDRHVRHFALALDYERFSWNGKNFPGKKFVAIV